MPADQIDPSSVPDWPHPVVSVGADGIHVDGQPIVMPPGVDLASGDARQLALQAVASRYAELNRPIKVRAREADGTAWDLVLAPDGSVVPIGDSPVEFPGGKPTRKKKRGGPPRGQENDSGGPKDKKRGLVAVAVFAAVVLLLGVGVFALRSGDGGPVRPKRTPPTTPPAANLPVDPPPRYGARASWAIEAPRNDEEITGLPGDLVAMISDQKVLEVRDVHTGVMQWQQDLPGGANGKLHVTEIDGDPVLAVDGSGGLFYWELDDKEHRSKKLLYPETGDVDVSFVGKSPLLLLPNQTAGYFWKGKARIVDVPLGATAIAAQGAYLLAVDKAGRMWQLRDSDDVLPEPTNLPVPVKGAELLRAAVLSNGMFLTAWLNGGKHLVVLYEAPGGDERGRREMVDERLEKSSSIGPEESDPLLQATDDASVAAVGNMVVFPKLPVAYTIDDLEVMMMSQGRLYARVDGGYQELTPYHRAEVDARESVPLLVIDDVALLATDKLDRTLLYALHRSDGRSPSPSEDSEPEPNDSGTSSTPESTP
ncbi:MAG: hypothetical protein GEV07_12740 [Streptosporangiales bacterium]|nr:hypothetical protein [Streptosporangiales bacterium]